MNDDKIRIFIGNEIGNIKAEKALHFSLINTNSTNKIELNWMDEKYVGSLWDGWNKGRTHNVQNTRHGWKTNFSCFRWAIPELCNFKGRAIYLDVDQIVLKDIEEFYNLLIEEKYFVLTLKPERTDVMLLDCSKFKFSDHLWPEIPKMKQSGYYQASYRKKIQDLGGIGGFDKKYNCLDGKDYNIESTRLLHFTEMKTQPWNPFPSVIEYKQHPLPQIEKIWHETYKEALRYEEENNVVLGSPKDMNSPYLEIGNTISKVAGFSTNDD